MAQLWSLVVLAWNGRVGGYVCEVDDWWVGGDVVC